jgi:plasmid maintenance system antidote protein VapI
MSDKIRMPQHDLLDIIKDEFDLRTDAELAEFLDLSKPQVSKIRTGEANVTAHIVLAVHDATDWSISKIRGYLPGSSIAE